jgi:protein gp37
MSDLFHPDVPNAFIAEVFAVMALADRHTFQVLTKRPQRMASLLDSSAFVDLVTEAVRERDSSFEGKLPWPLRSVWLGTSIESNRYIWRADHLRKTPAAVRFLSCEPLLGPLPDLDFTGIDWVIVGGESGPKARPMHPQWIRDIRDRCLGNPCENCRGGKLRPQMGLAGCACGISPVGDDTRHPGRRPVAFLLKQWGEWAPGHGSTSSSALTQNLRVTTPWTFLDHDGTQRDTNELNSFRVPAGWTKMARVGKRSAGRELDGQVWDQYPWLPHHVHTDRTGS